MNEEDMSETARRLYKAAGVLAGITGQSALAVKLGVSPQTIMNWETRGVSSEGMITAEEQIGCFASWIRTGIGRMYPTEIVTPAHGPEGPNDPRDQPTGNVSAFPERREDYKDGYIAKVIGMMQAAPADARVLCWRAVKDELEAFDREFRGKQKSNSPKKGRRKSSS